MISDLTNWDPADPSRQEKNIPSCHENLVNNAPLVGYFGSEHVFRERVMPSVQGETYVQCPDFIPTMMNGQGANVSG